MPVDQPLPADIAIGLDLARHRALCVTEIDGRRSVVPLAPDHRGLVLRWVDTNNRKHRITDRILDMAGMDQQAAIEVARAVAECVFPEKLPALPLVAIPAAFGPACRASVVDGFRQAGIEISDQHLVERPIAAFACWLHHRSGLGSPDPIGPMLLLDNDGGQISVCAIDNDARRVLFTAPLSAGPDEAPDIVIDRLHSVVRELDRLRSGHDLVRSDEWASVSAAISQVAVSGSMSEHPRFLELLNRVLPAAAIVRDPVVGDPSEIVGSGLISLDALSPWTAGWPTLDLSLDGQTIVETGPLDFPLTNSATLDVEVGVRPGAVLSLTDRSGAAVRLRAGSMLADGIELPADLHGQVTIRVLCDGRVLILGEVGVRPLSFTVDWPLVAANMTASAVGVTAVGRRPLQLVNPTADRSHRTTAA